MRSSRCFTLAVPIVFALALALALPGCRRTSIGRYPTAPIVLISIDTLRADHLPLYGYRNGSTPEIDRLAEEGYVFDEIYSPVPLTLPAHASLLTGLLPPRHGVRDNIGYTLAPTHRTLAARFKAAGWRTGGAVSSYVLRAQTGLSSGFDFYDAALEIAGDPEAVGAIQRDGSQTADALARWIEHDAGGRFFAFLHLYEPHTPYAPPPEFAAHRQPYDGEIAYADAIVGRFLDRLKSSRHFDDAIVAIVGDHGEGLNDHGEAEHGIFLYREALHVPFILRLPGGDGRRHVASGGSLVDVAATLLDLAGFDANGLDGVSLRGALAGTEAPSRPLYAETLYPRLHLGWSELFAVTQGPYRFIRAPHEEAYDIRADPRETKNLAAALPSTFDSMRRWLDAQVRSSTASAPSEVAPEVRKRLQALGYVGSTPAPAGNGAWPDPKDAIGSYAQYKSALKLRDEGRTADAIAALRRLVETNPRMLDAWETLGVTLVRAGQTADGIKALGEVIALEPTKPETHLALARIHALESRTDVAVQHAELAARKAPGEAYEVLAQLMMDRQQPGRAADYARRSIAADPDRAMSHFTLGTIAHRAGRWAEALAAFRAAEAGLRLQKQRVVRNLHASMGDCLARLGRAEEAEREFIAELEAIPASREARVALAMLYRSQGKDQAVRDVLAGLITAESPQTAETYWTVVRTLGALGDRAAAREWASRARARFPGDRRFR